MILDHVLIADMLIDGTEAQLTADTIRTISSDGTRVAPTIVGAGEIIRYIVFLGNVRPFLFRLSGVRSETESFIEHIVTTSLAARSPENEAQIMTNAYRLCTISKLSYSMAHLAASASMLRETALCSKATISILANSSLLQVSIVKEHGSNLAEISIDVRNH